MSKGAEELKKEFQRIDALILRGWKGQSSEIATHIDDDMLLCYSRAWYIECELSALHGVPTTYYFTPRYESFIPRIILVKKEQISE